MFNVLPDNFKKVIKSQYKKRRLVVCFLAVILLQISFFIFILPSYIFLVTEKRNLLAESQRSEVSNVLGNNITASKVFRNVNNDLFVLSSDIEQNNIEDFLSKLISLEGAEIKIKEIVYKNKTATATTTTIVLRGVALNRNALLLFSNIIKADSLFGNVDLPVSNFVKDKNIDFSMTIVTKT